MTRFFLLVLIALLPLRGWSAQVMVMQMAAPMVAASSQDAESAMAEDCALHMRQATATDAEHPGNLKLDHKPQHKGCQSCQLCMPLGALQASGGVALAPSAHSVPLWGSTLFASADRARHAKPPIS